MTAQSFVDLADRLLAAKGKNATFHYDGGGEQYDPGTGDVTHVGPTTFEAKISPPRVLEEWTAEDVLERGQIQTIVAAKNITVPPVLGMKVVYRGRAWMIEKVKVLDSGLASGVAAYVLTMRGGAS